MKLLLDENLSPRLICALQDLYPGSVHVRDAHLERASDEQIWTYAAANEFAIVSKDSDFRQRSFLYGPPPKIVWVQLGNCSTGSIEALLRARHSELLRFYGDPAAAFLAVRR